MSSCGLWVSVQLDSFFPPPPHTHIHQLTTGPWKSNSRSFLFSHVCLESGSLEKNICDFLQGRFPVRQDFPFLKIIKFTFECECGERYRDTGCDQIVASFKKSQIYCRSGMTLALTFIVWINAGGRGEKGKRNHKGKAVDLNVIWGFFL